MEWTWKIRFAPSVAVFKTRLLAKIRPPAKSVFGIHDSIGLSYLTQLRAGLSKLNFHKIKHNFRDTINPMCPTNDSIETTEHFLLLCPVFDIQRRNLLAGVYAIIRPFGYDNLSNEVLTQLFLYGDEGLPNDLNRNILELTLQYIHKTGRFVWDYLNSMPHSTTMSKSFFVESHFVKSCFMSLFLCNGPGVVIVFCSLGYRSCSVCKVDCSL